MQTENNTKQCSACKLVLPVSEFGVNRASKDGIAWKCKACNRQYYYDNKEKIVKYNTTYYRKWRKENPEKSKAKDKRAGERRKQRRYEFKKQFSCQNCGENDPPCLDFHHLEPREGGKTIAELINLYGVKDNKTLLEVAKCIVLCSNCHRKLHYYGTLPGFTLSDTI